MRRLLTVLALPAVTLALGAVLFSAQSTSVAGPAGSASFTSGNVSQVDTGAGIAITKTNWQETGDGSVIVPTSGGGRPKR